MEWLDQDSAAEIMQRQIDLTIDSEWAENKWKIQADLAEVHGVCHPIVPSDSSLTNLHISLKEMVLNLSMRLPYDIAKKVGRDHGHRYDKVLDVFFKVLESGEITSKKPGQSAVVQSLAWVYDHIDLLKAQGVGALVIDELREVDKSDVLEIIRLIEQIDISCLSVCIVQQAPLKLLNLNTLGDLIAKEGRISFVVRGLLYEATEISLRVGTAVPPSQSQAIAAWVPKRRGSVNRRALAG